jgi:AraC family transcriptional regulator, transcriptional activator FtrA
VIPNDEIGISPALCDALCRAHRRGARIVSLCTGAFTLAEAGLLDGRRATTHWRRAAELVERWPSVEVDPNVLFVESDNVWTSAGSAASLDLCLHLVRCDFGAEVATALARRLVVPPQRDGGQAQFVDDPVLVLPGADLFGETLAWMEEHLHEPVSVADLAARSAMSPRTFARRFRQTTGTTPHQWLLRQRINLARRLLETTEEPIEVIADRCGFGTAANLRIHFRRLVRTTPQAYRNMFCCPKEEVAS